MNATRAEAEAVAAELPVGFGLISVVLLVELIFYSFQLWKACTNGTTLSDPSTRTDSSDRTGASYRRMFRSAKKQVHRAARHHDVKLTDEDLDVLTQSCLDHVDGLSKQRFAACCAEPFSIEVAAMGDEE